MGSSLERHIKHRINVSLVPELLAGQSILMIFFQSSQNARISIKPGLQELLGAQGLLLLFHLSKHLKTSLGHVFFAWGISSCLRKNISKTQRCRIDFLLCSKRKGQRSINRSKRSINCSKAQNCLREGLEI